MVTPEYRAVLFDNMMAVQLDADHGSSGFLVWDWKDPTVSITGSAGGKPIDPMWNCYSIGPADPAAAVLMKYADRVPFAPILQ